MWNFVIMTMLTTKALSLRLVQPPLQFSAQKATSKQESDWIYKLAEDFSEHKCADCLSQHSQDEYGRQIFNAIGETNRYYVEFGFNSPSFEGGSGANTLALYNRGWKGLLMDGDFDNSTINLHKHYLFQSNIVSLFQKYDVPKDMDYLSVDMDSHDLFVLRSILAGDYKPRVINAEFNSNYWGSKAALTQYDPTLETNDVPAGYKFEFTQCAWGTSPGALDVVAKEFGYTLVGRLSHFDMIWIRNDLVQSEWKLPSFEYFFNEKDNVYKNGKTFKEHGVHSPQKTAAIFDKMMDYTTWQRTKDMKASVAAAKSIICSEFKDHHCWARVAKQSC